VVEELVVLTQQVKQGWVVQEVVEGLSPLNGLVLQI
jgi:hypothetical protein